ncbi:hypothetical protein M407DRAFT_23228 [Tulasnella calospora MUT 4182]|uniref:Uncharacterized protein n=1 Tax=Tulasnella calospora MUT 4182 TaxID=1051891 RepID=A0A0C3L1F0_9AGAM|nr:hypothetical protein M407DRAFT_23228 [Tulasnella calospora MUT 4182]
MLDGYSPLAVANALPNFHHVIPDFHSNHALQAQLILSWGLDFASQVLATWKPPQSTWTEVFGSAKDTEHAVKLTLSALGPAGVREAIAAVGKVHGGAKQVILMNALRVSLKQDRPSRPRLNEPGTSDVSTTPSLRRFPIAPSANETPSQRHLEGSPAESKTTSNPLTVSTNKPLAFIIGSNPSGSIVPQRIGAGQVVSPRSTKENVHPSAYNESKDKKARLKSAQLTREGTTSPQKLFAADDARRAAIVASKTTTVTSPQPPQQTKSLRTDTTYHEASLPVKALPQLVDIDTAPEFRDTGSGSYPLTSSIHDTKTSSTERPDGKNYEAAQLSVIAKASDDHRGSTQPSATRAPSPAPSDDDYESGMDV